MNSETMSTNKTARSSFKMKSDFYRLKTDTKWSNCSLMSTLMTSFNFAL